MTHLLERSVLILLASTALTACVSSPYEPRLVDLPPPPAPVAPPPPQLAARPLDLPPAPRAAPVESRALEPLPLPPAQSAPASVMAQAETAPRLAFTPPGEDAAARARSRRHVEAPATYTVRKGDTLEKVASRLGTDIPTLARANGLRKPYRLTPGQVLENPKAEKAETAEKGASARRSARAASETYVVKSGDTLFSIARRHGTTVEALRAENGLNRQGSIHRGQKLRLPGAGGEEAREEAPAEPRARAGRVREPEPEAAAVAGRSVTGRVVTISTPGKAYRVRKGDTLEKVARKLDSQIDELARLNKLKKPYRLRPGQTIRGPGGSAKAYVVAHGDTLSEIARRFDVSVEELRAANGLRRGASVAPGRKLRLPAGYRDRGPLAAPVRPESTVPAYRPPPSSPTLPPPPASEGLPSAPQPYSGRPTPPPPRPYTPPVAAPTASPPLSDAQVMQMGRGRFEWPIRGELISGFGGKGTGPRNDGLNIRAPAGEAVRAAAAGDVVYAGDQVPGFGNLVLIKHADGWVTAYGHLGRVDVRMQQKVTQGQQIGQAGSTGGVTEPQLHFEVRYAPTPQERARPVDPQLVLPQ